jgi:hypothetical protein
MAKKQDATNEEDVLFSQFQRVTYLHSCTAHFVRCAESRIYCTYSSGFKPEGSGGLQLEVGPQAPQTFTVNICSNYDSPIVESAKQQTNNNNNKKFTGRLLIKGPTEMSLIFYLSHYHYIRLFPIRPNAQFTPSVFRTNCNSPNSVIRFSPCASSIFVTWQSKQDHLLPSPKYLVVEGP